MFQGTTCARRSRQPRDFWKGSAIRGGSRQSTAQLLIRGGRIITAETVLAADLAVAEGRIAAIGPDLRIAARRTLDARGLHLFPGILDAHVHFNEPGRARWEGLSSGPASLAAGGGAAFFDMPLNSVPPTLDGASLRLKRRIAQAKSALDFGLWGGLVPGNRERLGELRDEGAIGLKAFLCSSGVDEFQAVTDWRVLRAGMKRAAQLGLIVAVHAEDEGMAARLLARARRLGRADARAWLESRPVEVELAAISRVLELAGETGCSLHVVHVSSPEGISLIEKGRRRGIDVTAETCPHYLLLDRRDVISQGAAAKCAPPLRNPLQARALRRQLVSGRIDTVGSDHSPAPPALKRSPDFFRIWGGISGCQHAFPLLISECCGRRGESALPLLARVLARNVARRFGIASTKGSIEVGKDADLTLLDLSASRALDNAELLYRHRQGPYGGRACAVRVVATWVRGREVFRNGRVASGPRRGQFLRPIRN